MLSLRPLTADDWGDLFSVAADPLIWEQHPAQDRWRQEVFAGFFAEALASGGALAVIENACGAIVGSSRYHNYNAERGDVEIGWSFLTRRLWGGAANREKKTLMLNHAFARVDSVVFRIGAENLRSRRAAEKLGSSLEDEYARPDGGKGVTYRLRREIWLAQPR